MIHMRALVVGLLISCFTQLGQGQETFPRNGVEDERHTVYAFTNATIFVSSDQRMTNATMVVQYGEVVSVSQSASPPNAVIVDCAGKYIYPSFIDAYGGINALSKKQLNALKKADKGGADEVSNWNKAIRPERKFNQAFPLDSKKSEDWLSSGFGLVNEHHRDGIMRGTSQVFVLGEHKANEAIVDDECADHFSFSKGSSDQDYPSSLVGAIALFRQTMYDAQWHQSGGNEMETNPSLKAMAEWSEKPKIFQVSNSLSCRNVLELTNEFGMPMTIVGAGKEYLIQDEIPSGTSFILPLNYPKAYDVSDPYLSRMVSLEELKHWENAPRNPIDLMQKGFSVAISRDTVSGKTFQKNLMRSMNYGLSQNDALRSLTETPAEMLGVSESYGTLEPRKKANFFISNDTLGSKNFDITEHWTLGKKVYKSEPVFEKFLGQYNLVVDEKNIQVTIEDVSEKKVKAKAESNDLDPKIDVSIDRQEDLIAIVLKEKESNKVLYRLTGKITFNEGVWDGQGLNHDGEWVKWAAIRDRKYEPETKTELSSKVDTIIPKLQYPNMAYGWDSLDMTNTFVITNAVVWTCADTGILKRADVFVVDGKIKSIGVDQLFPTDVKRVDAKGKHLTPGLVDEHSHIALRGGVNEWAQASSAEVRMSDAIDPWNINIYRQLAGGVTSAQLLHGSANPIGGQSAIVKFKWGASASEMLYENSPKFIKFALGENVKRSNRRDHGNRFPLTRMGVEQSMMDAFVRAESYDLADNERGLPLRRDLELDAIREIANGERHISCHSYVQSEILMLMNLADSLGFKVNTFTHILEGYKVRDELAKHGANASTFSDWWAYKYEVNDAIPYNAAMLHKAGVNTAINSDDAEMGRRLNQEAAKAIKYGGLDEEAALNLVTINPAKMLHLDDRVGSIEVGKDADLVLWSENPLSVYAKAEKTFIEGVLYYDSKESESRWQRDQKERARIEQKMIKGSGPKKRPRAKTEEHYHCDTELEDYLN